MSKRDNPLGGSDVVTANYTTNGDLTAARYKVAHLFDSMTVGRASATTNNFAGIIDNIPLSGTGQSIRVVISGITHAIAGAAFTAGAVLTIDANAQVVVVNTSTQGVIGYAITSAAAASEVVSVMVKIDNSRLA